MLEKAFIKITLGFFFGGIVTIVIAVMMDDGLSRELLPFYKEIAYGPHITDDSMERAAWALYFIGGVGLVVTGGLAYLRICWVIRKRTLPNLPKKE